MSLTSTTTRVDYSGNGSTTAFPITFAFWSADDLTVINTVTATGVQTAWTRGNQFTVSGGSGSTGTLTATSAPAAGTTLSIISALPNTQPTSLPPGGQFPSASVEEQLDQIVRQVQQLAKLIVRALVQPDGDTNDVGKLPAKISRASTYLGFDTNGDPVALAAPTGTATVSAAMASVIAAATLALARTAMGLGTAAVAATGTSGATVPLLNAANTMSGALTMSAAALRFAKGAAVTSAATTDIWTPSDGNLVHVTGTVGITNLGTAAQAGDEREVIFDGALTLAHSDTVLVLPSRQSFTTVAGDILRFRADTTTKIVLTNIQRADGAPGGILNEPGTPTTISNNNAETAIESFTVKGNTLGLARGIRFEMIGDFFNNTGSNATVQIKIKYGATTIYDGGAVSLATAGTSRSVRLSGMLVSGGSTGAQRAIARVSIGAAGDITGTAAAPGSDLQAAHASVAEDSTADKTFQITVTLGSASVNLQMVSRFFVARVE